MTEIVVFPDVEALLIAALATPLSVPISTKVPNPRPVSFVRVKRVGGTQTNRVTDAALVVFECWAATDVAASDLAILTRAHVHALAQTAQAEDYVRRVRESSGPQSFPDPATGTPRYQFTVQIDTRGVAL